MTDHLPAELTEEDLRLVAAQNRTNAAHAARTDSECRAAHGRPWHDLTPRERTSVMWARSAGLDDLAGALAQLRAITAEADGCGCQRFAAIYDAIGAGPALHTLRVVHVCRLRVDHPHPTTTSVLQRPLTFGRASLDECAHVVRAVVDHERAGTR